MYKVGNFRICVRVQMAVDGIELNWAFDALNAETILEL